MPLPRRLPAILIARRCLFSTPATRSLSTATSLPLNNSETSDILSRGEDQLRQVESYLDEIDTTSGLGATRTFDTYPPYNAPASHQPPAINPLPDVWQLEKATRKAATYRVKRKDEGLHQIEGYIKDLEFLLRRIEVALYPLLDIGGKMRVLARDIERIRWQQQELKGLLTGSPLDIADRMQEVEEGFRVLNGKVDHMLDNIRHSRTVARSPVLPMSLAESLDYWTETVESRMKLLRNDSYPGGKLRVVSDVSYRMGVVLEGIEEGVKQATQKAVGDRVSNWRERVFDNVCGLLSQPRGLGRQMFIAPLVSGARPKLMNKRQAVDTVSAMLVETATTELEVEGAWKPTMAEAVTVLNAFEQLLVEFSSPTAKWYVTVNEKPVTISRISALKQLQELVEVGLDRNSRILPALETALKNLAARRSPQQGLNWLNEDITDPEASVWLYGFSKPARMPRVDAIQNMVGQLQKETSAITWQIRAINASRKLRKQQSWQSRYDKTFDMLLSRETVPRIGGQQIRAFSTSSILRKARQAPKESEANVAEVAAKTSGKMTVRQRMKLKEQAFLKALDEQTRLELQSTTGIFGQENPDVAPQDTEYDDDGMTMGADHTDSVNLRGFKPLKVGDLCELRMPDGDVQLGIYLRPSRGGVMTCDFLTPLGIIKKYFPARVAFTVDKFTPEEAVNVLLDYQRKVEDFKNANPRSTVNGDVIPNALSFPILEPVRKFMREATTLYTQHIDEFRRLHTMLAHDRETRTVKLAVAATMIFGKKHGELEKYATHMALMGDGMRFMGDRGFHRYTQTFRVRSKKDYTELTQVTKMLREANVKTNNEEGKELVAFVEKAKTLIALAEEARATGGKVQAIERPDLAWTESDLKFINYIQSRMRAYGLQITPLEGLCPLILRLVGGKYTESLTEKLDPAMMHDFLVDIGVHSPWQNTLMYDYNMKVPGYLKNSRLEQEQAFYDHVNTKTFEELGLQDKYEGKRKDFEGITAYAIDAADAKEIDDAISMEIVNDKETWFHVHVAHPSAFFDPEHPIMKVARNRGATKYLDPFQVPMLPHVVTNALGIRPDGPALTISSRVDDMGNVLEYKITPSILRNVKRITYKQLDDTLGTTPKPAHVFTVGEFPEEQAEKIRDEITEEDAAFFNEMQRRLEAVTIRRVRDGMVNPSASWSNIKLHDAELVNDGKPVPHPVFYTSYPSIKVEVYHQARDNNLKLVANDMVAESMILANSTIALYSAEHNLPMPFRCMEFNAARPDIIDQFVNHILPNRDRLGHARGTYESILPFMMAGVSTIQHTPGPHVTMGLPNGYVKATSPLRRFSDMIAHWNLESTLLPDTPLLFPTEKLTEELPLADIAEKMAVYGSYRTEGMWKAALVQRLMETDNLDHLGEKMRMLVKEPHQRGDYQGFAMDLALHAKLQVDLLRDSNDTFLNKNEWVWVRPSKVKMAERGVVFEYLHKMNAKEKLEPVRTIMPVRKEKLDEVQPEVEVIDVHTGAQPVVEELKVDAEELKKVEEEVKEVQEKEEKK